MSHLTDVKIEPGSANTVTHQRFRERTQQQKPHLHKRPVSRDPRAVNHVPRVTSEKQWLPFATTPIPVLLRLRHEYNFAEIAQSVRIKPIIIRRGRQQMRRSENRNGSTSDAQWYNRTFRLADRTCDSHKPAKRRGIRCRSWQRSTTASPGYRTETAGWSEMTTQIRPAWRWTVDSSPRHWGLSYWRRWFCAGPTETTPISPDPSQTTSPTSQNDLIDEKLDSSKWKTVTKSESNSWPIFITNSALHLVTSGQPRITEQFREIKWWTISNPIPEQPPMITACFRDKSALVITWVSETDFRGDRIMTSDFAPYNTRADLPK